MVVHRVKKMSLLLAITLSICLASVTVFGWSTYCFTSGASVRTGKVPLLAAKNAEKAQEAEAPPVHRATRTIYKPTLSDEKAELVLDRQVMELEKEIQESTKARLDLQRVNEFLEEDVEATEKLPTSDWQVSMAAGAVAAAITLGATDSWTLAALALASVYVVANGDPMEERTPVGAAARVVGRAALHSVQSLQPKVKSVARAAFRGDQEVLLLIERIEELEAENESLRLWQKRRNAVDNTLGKYTLSELKSKARANKLAVGGSKTTLLMRLVEAEVIDV